MFNVAIVGGEGMGNYPFFETKCINILRNKAKSGEGITLFTTGDEFVTKFATKFGITVHTFYTEWNKYGKNALKMRNEALLTNCNAIISFDDAIKDTQILTKMAIDKGIQNRFIKR